MDLYIIRSVFLFIFLFIERGKLTGSEGKKKQKVAINEIFCVGTQVHF